jgi:hypothetical protein
MTPGSRMCISDKSQISRDVLAYLVDHQDAQDTLEGIIEWWLVEQKIKQQTATVKEVLGELVGRKYLLVSKGMDSQIRYRINRRKSEEISTLVKDAKNQEIDN